MNRNIGWYETSLATLVMAIAAAFTPESLFRPNFQLDFILLKVIPTIILTLIFWRYAHDMKSGLFVGALIPIGALACMLLYMGLYFWLTKDTLRPLFDFPLAFLMSFVFVGWIIVPVGMVSALFIKLLAAVTLKPSI